MKQTVIMVTIAIALAACSPSEKKYEQAIADYIQTDNRGTWTDLQFKVLSMDVRERTVADSLVILRAECEADLKARIGKEEADREYWQRKLSGDPSGKTAAYYQSQITETEHRIDSLKNLTPESIITYRELDPKEVLLYVITCQYSYVVPGKDSHKKRTDIFLLSLDGQKVLGREKQQEQ